MLRVLSLASFVLLAGCATAPPVMAPVEHHATVAKPKVAAPAAKTFKQRWESKFFRNRAQQ